MADISKAVPAEAVGLLNKALHADLGHSEKVCAANAPADVRCLGKVLPGSVSLLLRISN